MIVLLEYLIAQHQDNNVSVAIKSKKVNKHNPVIIIKRNGQNILWELRGLHHGDIENVAGVPRASRIDFYIGMEDLIEQRGNFIPSTGTSLGNVQGLRIPVGTERPGGKEIRWKGPVGRVEIEDVSAIIPPFRLSKNDDSELILNIDRERAEYPITSEGGNQTTLELHFGVEHDYTVVQDGRLSIDRIAIEMTEDQYATVLAFIDSAIAFYQAM